MKSVFNLFIATEELYTSPYVQSLSETHDVELFVGETKIVSFVFRAYSISIPRTSDFEIKYDPHMIDITHASFHTSDDPYSGKMMVTLTIQPKYIGSTELYFSEPVRSKARIQRKLERV